MIVEDILTKRSYTLLIIADNTICNYVYKGNLALKDAYYLEHAFELFRQDSDILGKNSFWDKAFKCRRHLSPLEKLFLSDINDEVGRFILTISSENFEESTEVSVCFVVPTDKVDLFIEKSGMKLIKG